MAEESCSTPEPRKVYVSGALSPNNPVFGEFDAEYVGQTPAGCSIHPGLTVETWRQDDFVMHVIYPDGAKHKHITPLGFYKNADKWHYVCLRPEDKELTEFRLLHGSYVKTALSIHDAVMLVVSTHAAKLLLTP
jgi:hypothetical protein